MSVSEKITDAVTQTNTTILAEAPAMAIAQMYMTSAHSTGLMFANSVNAQYQQFIVAQAAATQGVTKICNIDNQANAISLAKLILQANNI